METIKSYKGFDKNWKCSEFQFEVGKSYTHEGKVKACQSGFHACEYPLDVFGYYAPSDSKFAGVEQSGDLSKESGDSKVASRNLTVKAEISIAGLVSAAVEYILSRCSPVDKKSPSYSTGDRSAATNTGNRSAATNTGYQSAATNTGYKSAASVEWKDSVAISIGIEGKAMAVEGSAIVLAYRNFDGDLIHIRASKVGENGIKPGVWYSLDENGEFYEVE